MLNSHELKKDDIIVIVVEGISKTKYKLVDAKYDPKYKGKNMGKKTWLILEKIEE
jgi:hypothetical protein